MECALADCFARAYSYGLRQKELLAICKCICYDFSVGQKRHMDGFPSGQRGQTVNLLQIASVVRIHLHPYAGVAE